MKLKQLLTVLFIVCLPLQALAAGNLKYGVLEFHPYLKVTETYNDNIYATPTDQKSDWINTLMPGIRLFLPYRAHQFAVEYNAVINSYANYSSENMVDHNASAMADLKIGSNFGLLLKDVYAKGHEPRATSASGDIQKYDTNAASLSATYQLAGRSKVQLDYTHTNWDFSSEAFRNRNEDLVAAYFYYRFLPKTSAFVEYDFKNVDYSSDVSGEDNRSHNAFVGVTWEMTANTKGTVKGGYLQKDYSLAGQDSLKAFSAWADISHTFSDTALLKVVAMRVANESALLGARYFITNGAYVEYTHKLTYKISAIARGSYGEDDYSNAIAPDTRVRNDKTWLLGVGLKYQFKDWLEFVLSYNYRDRNSNIDDYDLRENTYSLSINFML